MKFVESIYMHRLLTVHRPLQLLFLLQVFIKYILDLFNFHIIFVKNLYLNFVGFFFLMVSIHLFHFCVLLLLIEQNIGILGHHWFIAAFANVTVIHLH